MDPQTSFNWGNLVFLELTNGKIRCGVCQQECVRLISHMNGSIECSRGINMKEFKIGTIWDRKRSLEPNASLPKDLKNVQDNLQYTSVLCCSWLSLIMDI